jgi:hypothetical protein
MIYYKDRFVLKSNLIVSGSKTKKSRGSYVYHSIKEFPEGAGTHPNKKCPFLLPEPGNY